MAGQGESQYNIYDLGFDKGLIRNAVDSPELSALELQSQDPVSLGGISSDMGFSGGLSDPVQGGVPSQSVYTGELPQILSHGKQSFTDTTQGFRMGVDSDGLYKWIVGGASSSADWSVTTAGVFTVNGPIFATSGTIGGWTINTTSIADSSTEANANVLIDSANTLIRLGPTSGTYITLDGANQRIRSSNYSSGVSGFTIEPTLIEAENLVARGTMRGVSFKYDVISAIGGQLMVANSDALASDMTALDAATMTVRGDSTFSANDILVIRAVTASGIQEEWVRVTSAASAPTYSITRDLASSFGADSNPAWLAGTAVVKQGTSDGAASFSGGWLRLIGEGTNAPHYSVFKRTGVAYNAFSEYIRLGNLNGFLGYVSDEYGIAIGETNKFLKYDPTNGLRIAGNIENLIFLTAGEDITEGEALIIGTGTQTYSGASQATSDVNISSSSDWWGQTFLNSNGVKIKSVTFGIRNVGGSTDNYAVSIRAVTANVPTGSDIEGKTATASVGNGIDGDVTFTFPSAVTVSPNTTYAIVLRKTSGTSGSGPKYRNSNVYADGNYATSADSGVNWAANTGRDFRFSVTEIRTNTGEVYLSSAAANDEFVTNFIGFAFEDASLGETISVLVTGQTSSLSGLTVGSAYYLSDTSGEISTTPGSVSKKIGLSLSATSLLILNS